MVAVLLFALLMAVIFGLAIAVHTLLFLAVIAVLVWVIGFFYRPGGGIWYRW
ncbi:MAG: hydrophobic protein [Candidatus Dormibacteria bacterium]